MEDVIRPKGRENAFHPVAIGYRGDDGGCFNGGMIVQHHEANVVLRRLSLVYQHQLSRFKQADLSNHFRPDTSSRTGYQYLFATQKVTNALHIYLYLVTRQKVFDADFF